MKKTSQTCIAAIRTRQGKIIMAGERLISCSTGVSYIAPKPKIQKKSNGLLLGAGGDIGLCKLCVETFEPSKVDCDIETYMRYTFVPELIKLLKQNGYSDEHKLLRLVNSEKCDLLVGYGGQLYQIDIGNPDDDEKTFFIGRVILNDAPIPYAVGCGADVAYTLLYQQQQELGYNTKEYLDTAIRAACKLMPGCGLNDKNEVDFIRE